ncbi:DMT family transporter [Neisseria shayeganii]|uniref:DMT family transporter n=1 Tax=Neisseria shayeganii TaxID=607712 RepID=A0A7D7SPZ2_9NEIS|nr:DMT family transporter [Neisseria shayeganii]QMT40670.1 DMT family transporter [Neisseria shayeganii]
MNKLIAQLPVFITPPLLWAGNMIVARAIRDDIPPLTLAFGRWVISLLILLPFAWALMRRDRLRYRQHYRLIIGTALAGIAAFNTFVYIGLHTTTSTNALLLNSCIPVLIMLLGAVFYRQNLNRWQSLGLILSLAGVAVIILRGSWHNLLALRFAVGDVWVFAATACWAVYTLWMKRLPADIHRTGLTAVQILIGLFALLPFFLWETVSGATVNWQPAALLGLAYVGIFPSVVAYLCYTAAIARFGAVRAGLSIHLMPVFGTLLAFLLLDEQLHAYHWFGIAAIFGGILLSSRNADGKP